MFSSTRHGPPGPACSHSGQAHRQNTPWGCLVSESRAATGSSIMYPAPAAFSTGSRYSLYFSQAFGVKKQAFILTPDAAASRQSLAPSQRNSRRSRRSLGEPSSPAAAFITGLRRLVMVSIGFLLPQETSRSRRGTVPLLPAGIQTPKAESLRRGCRMARRAIYSAALAFSTRAVKP